MKKMVICLLVLFLVNIFGQNNEKKSKWEILSTTTIKAKEFINKHPEYDGRGVLIAVCDSGVDLGLSGLLETSDGKEKIVDARDFSGQYTFKAEPPLFSKDGSVYLKEGKHLYNLDKVIPNVDKKKVYIGYLMEEDAKNSEVKDLNGNKKENDVFGFVLYQDGEKWKVLIDSDGDGELANEKSYLDFSEGREFFSLKGKDRFSDYLPLNIAVNIDSEKKEVSFFMADGSHGTHVAGIAAGYKIDNQDGFNGIAPGAQILALKIGNNAYSGGATTSGSMLSAWRYAVKRAKEMNMPLVIQMSYGIGSELEGRAEAEKMIDELLYENPDVVATVSCGNEGPGLSTAGLPACAKEVLSVGAVLAKTTAKEIYGADLKQDEMFSFSSRGGESAKPDFVCPGFAAATVPLWEEGHNVMRGTSMASPQAAGACALLLSALKKEGLPIRRDILYSALRRGSEELRGYSVLDQGYGLLNIEKSFEIYKRLLKIGGDVFDFTVETKCPRYENLKGTTVYYRGAYYPKSGERQEIKIFPKFPIDFSEEKKVKFFKAFDIEKSGDFFNVVQGSTYIKAGEPARIYVTFNENVLKNPGLYSGKIALYPKNFSNIEKKNLGPDLIIPVTVILPFETSEKDGSYGESYVVVEKAKVKRLFFRVKGNFPVKLNISTKEKPEGRIAVQLFDPYGREKKYFVLSNEKRELEVLINPPCESGVYELDLYGNYLNTKAVNVKVEAKEIRFLIRAKDELKIKAGEGGKAILQLISQLKDAIKCSVEANITGYCEERNELVKTSDFSKSFSIGGHEEDVTFELEMNEQDYNLFTDIAVQIIDEDGRSLVSDGMSYRFLKISAGKGDGLQEGKKYKLLVSAAYANLDEEKNWNLKIKEIHHFTEPVEGKIKGGKSLEIYPDAAKDLPVTFSLPPVAIPSASLYVLKVDFKEKSDKGIKFSRNVLLKREK